MGNIYDKRRSEAIKGGSGSFAAANKDSGLYTYKLERTNAKGRREVHVAAGKFVGAAVMVKGRPTPGLEALNWAKRYPGWELCFA